jgi:hypothetical protein
MGYASTSTLYQQTADTAASSGISLTGVSIGDIICVVAAPYRPSTASGELITSVTSSPAATFAEVDSLLGQSEDAGGGTRRGIYAFWAVAASAGTHTITINFTNATDNRISALAFRLTGMSATPVDKTDTSAALQASASITAGPLATAASATSTAIAAVMGRWVYGFNGVSAGAGGAPSGFTVIGGTESNALMAFQVAYQELSSSVGVSAAWTVPTGEGDGTVAIVFNLLAASSTALRGKCKFQTGSGINGVTGVTVTAWRGNPQSETATVHVVDAESTGDVVYIPAPAGLVAGSQFEFDVKKGTSTSERGRGVVESA